MATSQVLVSEHEAPSVPAKCAAEILATATGPVVADSDGSTGGSGDQAETAESRPHTEDHQAFKTDAPGAPVDSVLPSIPDQSDPGASTDAPGAPVDSMLPSVPDQSDPADDAQKSDLATNSKVASAADATNPSDITPARRAPVAQQQAPGPRSCNFGGGLCELMVVEAIQEYMTFHGMENSLQSLRDEVDARSQAASSGRSGSVDNEGRGGAARRALVGSEMAVARALADFDGGHRDALFEVWNMLVPALAADSPHGCALELRLRVHFGVFRVRQALTAAAMVKASVPEASGPEEACGCGDATDVPEPDFEDLKAFLAAHPAANLDETAESLAPLFALPFVPQPHKRAGFKFIFEDVWVQKLRVDLQSFLTPHASARHAPLLRHLAGSLVVAKGPKSAPPPASWHELVRIADLGLAAAVRMHAQDVQNAGVGGGMRKGAHFFKDIAHARWRLASVAAQPDVAPPPPTSAQAQNRALGTAPEAHELAPGLWPCSREALDASYRDALRSPSKRLHSRHESRNLESRARTATALLPVPPALDFGHIAAVIAGEPYGDAGAIGKVDADENGALAEVVPSPPLHAVLRAVLRRLASPDEPVRPRRTFLAAFACFGALRALAERLGEIIAAGDAIVSELSLAVLAVCACEAVGRKEIEQAETEKPGCIAALVLVLQRSTVGSPVHIQCLAVLQRLSLRRKLQSDMITLGAVDWVLQTLRCIRCPDPADYGCIGDEPGSPDFSLEFASALLMNLTLRSSGRRRCIELGAYEILLPLIEHPNPQVRTHVNGSLYSLLGVASFRANAHQQNAEPTLKAALMRAEGDNLLRRQLEYLLTQLSRNESGEADDDSDAEAGVEGDVDDGENFLDEEELAGHFLLVSSAACAAAAESAAAGVVAAGAGGDMAIAATAADAAAASAAAAAEAAAAEEALRLFRANPTVADAQQRRFHAFIAMSAGGLCSPIARRRSRLSNYGDNFSSPSPYGLGPLLSPSPAPLLSPTHESSSQASPQHGIPRAAPMNLMVSPPRSPRSPSPGNMAPVNIIAPPVSSVKQNVSPRGAGHYVQSVAKAPGDINQIARGPAKGAPIRQTGGAPPSGLRPPRARSHGSQPRGNGAEVPPASGSVLAGRADSGGSSDAVQSHLPPQRAAGAAAGRGRGAPSNAARNSPRTANSAPPALPPLVAGASAAAPASGQRAAPRSRSAAPPRENGVTAAQAAAAVAESALAAGGAGPKRRPKNPSARNPPLAPSGRSTGTPRGGPIKSSGSNSLPQLPSIHPQRRGG